MSEIPWLDEAMEIYKARPERIEHIFMWVYCQGVMNAEKAFKTEEQGE